MLPRYQATEANLDYKLKKRKGMLTTDEYICNLKRHGVDNTVPDEIYQGCEVPIYHICNIHNYRFLAKPNNVIHGYPCPLCNKENNRINNEKNYKQKLVDKNIPVLLDDKYVDHSTKVYHICLHCNNRWKTTPAYVLKNKFPCPKCAKMETSKLRTKTQEEYINEVYHIFGDSLSIIGEYNGVKNKIDTHCNICGHNWKPLAENLIQGHGCPHCRDINTGNRYRKTLKQYKQEVCNLHNDIIVIADKYYNSNTPILHKCKLCNYNYYQTPSNVLSGYGKCPLCNKYYGISENEFIELLHRNNKQVKLLSPYISKKDNIECQCLKCNYIWTSVAFSLLNTMFNCPNCAINDRKKLLISNDEFAEKVHEKFPNIELLHEYNGSYNSMDCHCRICNYIWTVKRSHKLYYTGCPNCAGNIKKTNEQFLSEISDILDPDIEIIGTYNGANNTIECRCKKCNSIIMTTPSTLKKGSGCKKCKDKFNGKLKQKTHERFLEEVRHIHNNKINILSEYNGSNNKVKCECTICGYVWYSVATSLTHQKTGCPSCNTSHGEKYVQSFLDTNNIKYVHPAKFDNLIGIGGRHLSYDFYLPTYNLAIECQGEQHERPVEYFGGQKRFVIQKIHDTRKRRYVHDNNINLLEIWYYENNKINKILTQTLNNLKSESIETVTVA